MKYSKTDGVHIVEVPVADFRIILCDTAKKSAAQGNYCNAGFFANFNEGKDKFTLPVGHLVADYAAQSAHVDHYCKERGYFRGFTFCFDSGKWKYDNPFYGKAVSTLVVRGGKAHMEDLTYLPDTASYVISGVPIMRYGQDVKFATYVRNQGWGGSSLYATWHTFVGLKRNSASKIYVMGMKTRSGNMISTAEAYNKFKAMGFVDVIKLDGGGSFHLNVGGKVVQSTLGNRRINTIVTFGGNPYPVPTRALTKGKKGDDVRWLQFELASRGFTCSVDGSFGPATKTALMAYQVSAGLDPDGSCGPATRAELLK